MNLERAAYMWRKGQPFLTFYTPTFRRPDALAACLASVSGQTMCEAIEQIVIPDHVGRGIGGMYLQVPQYADAVHGAYVHFLADDDTLADPASVEQVFAQVLARDWPKALVVRVDKGGRDLPIGPAWPPRQGHIDLGNLIVREDVWRPLARAGAYGNRYEGDYDFAAALAATGIVPVETDLLFMRGDVRHGVPEVAA